MSSPLTRYLVPLNMCCDCRNDGITIKPINKEYGDRMNCKRIVLRGMGNGVDRVESDDDVDCRLPYGCVIVDPVPDRLRLAPGQVWARHISDDVLELYYLLTDGQDAEGARTDTRCEPRQPDAPSQEK